jgi:transglutaminase-like putative cysteine protease
LVDTTGFPEATVRMSILSVNHVTVYRYRQPVSFGEHRMMFRPRDGHDQRVLESRLTIEPEPVSLRWVHDVFDNCVTLAEFGARARELRFESTVRLQHVVSAAPEFQIEDYARTYPFSYSADEMPDLLRSIERRSADPQRLVDKWVRQFIPTDGMAGTNELLAAMTAAIHKGFTYVAREESGIQSPAETLKLGSGSCRDFAFLMMEAVRALGLAARFVSGYLYSPARDGVRNVGGGSTHAWMQAYLPGAGWVEFDPTNGIVGNRDLVRVAVARDPRQAVPLSGSWTGFPSDSLGMTVAVHVTCAEDEGAQSASAA